MFPVHPRVSRSLQLCSWIFLIALVLNSCQPAPSPITHTPAASPTLFTPPTPLVPLPTNTPTPPPSPIPLPSSTATSPPATPYPDPYELISIDPMLTDLEQLTAIQEYSGWRTAGTQGESEALQFVEDRLLDFTTLNEMGMEIKRQTFPIFMTTEIWEARLFLTIDGKEVETPVNGLRGSRYSPSLAKNFDSDGSLEDAQPNPMTVSGAPVLVRAANRLFSLQAREVKDRLIFLDYSLIDSSVKTSAKNNLKQVIKLISYHPVGLVLLSQYSNKDGESHGTFALDGGLFNTYDFEPKIPILYTRVEDMAPAGIATLDDLEKSLDGKIETARLIWDSDVLLPAQSGNLIAHIPGQDSTQAVILGAHIDSPNTPGAFDNGSGSVILLEVARVINAAHIQPPIDLYLVWFGSEEIGLVGSSFFASTHQGLLDHTLAMLQIDALGYPLENKKSAITMDIYTYGQFGNDQPTLADYLNHAVTPRDIQLSTSIDYAISSDNAAFSAFDVPNISLIYYDKANNGKSGGYLWYATHFHDPYETVQLVREVSSVLLEMTYTTLTVALQAGQDKPSLWVVPAPTRRALILANHCQSPNLAPLILLELGMAFSWNSFDVDLLPYGQPVSPTDLKDTSLVIVLPALNYPREEGFAWTDEEFNLLETYVKDGGFLVLANSLHNFSATRVLEDNDNVNALALNALSTRFGITFTKGEVTADNVMTAGNHPLTASASTLKMAKSDGVPFQLQKGVVLYQAGGKPAMALIDYGEAGGQVLVVADMGLLYDFGRGGKNLVFLKNLASYVSGKLPR